MLQIDHDLVPYVQKVSRGRSIRITVKPGGVITVHAPRLVFQKTIDAFVESKIEWITDAYLRVRHMPPAVPQRVSRREYLAYKETARTLVHARITFFNQHYQYTYGKIAIRNQKTRWGSCSKKGNLNFSYKLARMRPELADYVVVHELCHLREFNHSERFWDLVAETIPNYRELRKDLKGGHLQ
ncbi:MAG: SprT family zinc-dependent metalloprotease [Minisyncoccia bacterium]